MTYPDRTRETSHDSPYFDIPCTLHPDDRPATPRRWGSTCRIASRIVHVQRGDGHTLETGKVAMTRASLVVLFERWKGCRLVIEAGGHSPWISRLGTACGMEVVVANPRRVELISKSDRKTNRTDAQFLTELGRTNPQLLAPIQHRSAEAQADLGVLRARDELVRARTSMINHVRGVLKSNGYRAATCSADSFGKKASTAIPLELQVALQPIVATVASLTNTIHELDGQIERLCAERYPITRALRQIGGVGPVVALTFVLTLDDPKRFRRARDVGAYLGLVPRKKSSGASDPQMHITQAGDRSLRRLLVIAANYILGVLRTRLRSAPLRSEARRRGQRPRSPRNERASRSLASWRCGCTTCGGAVRSTTRCTPPNAAANSPRPDPNHSR